MINFLDFTSIVGVLTVGNFSYSSFREVRNPLDDSFKKVPSGINWLKRTLENSAEKHLVDAEREVSTSEDIEVESFTDSKSIIRLDVFEVERKNSIKIHARLESFSNFSGQITDREKACHLFVKNLPPLYLMSAFFGVYILTFAALQSQFVDDIGDLRSNIRESVILFMEMVSIFYFYIIISTFNIRIFKAPRSIYTLGIFFGIVLLFHLLRHFLIGINLVLSINDFCFSLLLLFFCSFSFTFHLSRVIQIKITYLLLLFGSFVKSYLFIKLYRLSTFYKKVKLVVSLVFAKYKS